MFLTGFCNKYAFLALIASICVFSVALSTSAAAQDDTSSGVQNYLEQLKKRLEAYQSGQVGQPGANDTDGTTDGTTDSPGTALPVAADTDGTSEQDQAVSETSPAADQSPTSPTSPT